jgi:hypothetical protein
LYFHRPRRFGAFLPVAALLAAAVANGCAGAPDAPDWLDQLLAIPEAGDAAPRIAPGSADEPYPNLAAVPPRPARPVARDRDARIAALMAERDAAMARREGLAAGTAGSAAPDLGARVVGRVEVDALGIMPGSADDVLRAAIAAAARAPAARLRLAGGAAAALAVADRLVQLGARRAQIDLAPAPVIPGARRQTVEIAVAGAAPSR